jgi:hypothetical protein
MASIRKELPIVTRTCAFGVRLPFQNCARISTPKPESDRVCAKQGNSLRDTKGFPQRLTCVLSSDVSNRQVGDW